MLPRLILLFLIVNNQKNNYYFLCRILASHALDDNVVPIESNHRHGPDGHAARERSDEAVQLAHQWSESPGLVEVGDGHEWEHGSHHQEIRESCNLKKNLSQDMMKLPLELLIKLQLNYLKC